MSIISVELDLPKETLERLRNNLADPEPTLKAVGHYVVAK